MAALTCSVATNASTAGRDRLPSKTSFQGLMRGEAPITLGKGLKAAFVSITFDGGDYASGGVTASMLTALPGWTAVLGAVPAWFTDTNPKQASYNADTDKVIVQVLAGTEHTAAALSGTVKMLVLGY